jgi:heme-degrading monooxygenase HmoA
MWVRLGSFSVKPGRAEALRTAYNERAVPKVRAVRGNLGCLLLEPVADGEAFVAMTIWESRAAGEAYDASGTAAEVVSLVREYFAGPPVLRSYESWSESDSGPPITAAAPVERSENS